MPTFDLYALRFCFAARETVHLPNGATANMFRGQFGKILKRRAPEAYSRFFAPVGEGPSGLHDPPRPFVFRASHLDGITITAGERFHVGINLFNTRAPELVLVEETLAELASKGLRADLDATEGLDLLRLELGAGPEPRGKVRVRFLTPTELKGAERPEFGMLLARIRDRVSTLRALYGAGPLEIDFKALGERAGCVRMTRCEIEHVKLERVSRTTGQQHSLGGFMGLAEYEGDLGEFIPYLEVARWTGVGRQTVWGKGEIACETF